MLKKYLSSSIIVLFQFILLGLVISICAPLLLKNNYFAQHVNLFLVHYQPTFLIYHGLFYLAFYVAWPRVVTFIAASQSDNPSMIQINKAIQVRLYLLATFLSIELINFLR